MNIKYMTPGELVPYDKNPRINDQAVDLVANSIREFGFKQPIVIDRNNVIIAGHTRWKAARELGLERIPCIMADDLTPAQVKAYRLVDNKVAEASEWDFDLLDEELQELDGLDIDMSDFGFVQDEVDTAEAVEDNYEPDIPTEPMTKKGQIWRLGDHRLMVGDSTSSRTAGSKKTVHVLVEHFQRILHRSLKMRVKCLVFHRQKLSDKQCRRQLKRQKNKSVQIVQILRAIMVVSKESS